MSTDPFDAEKDMLVDGKKVEVKTQSKMIKYDSFALSPNQLPKLQGVDATYFVAINPASEWDGLWSYPEAGNIYRCAPNFEYFTWYTNRYQARIAIPLKQEAMVIVHKMEDSVLEYMSKFATRKSR